MQQAATNRRETTPPIVTPPRGDGQQDSGHPSDIEQQSQLLDDGADVGKEAEHNTPPLFDIQNSEKRSSDTYPPPAPITPIADSSRSEKNTEKSSSSLAFLASSEDMSHEFWKGMKTISEHLRHKLPSVAYPFFFYPCLDKVFQITKNCHQSMKNVVDYMSRQDERLSNLEESQRVMQEYFVKTANAKMTKFPLQTVEEVLNYGEEGDYEDLIAL